MSEQEQETINNTLNEDITNVLTKNATTVSNAIRATQDLTIEADEIDCETFDVTQKISLDAKMASEINNESTTEIQKKMMNLVANDQGQAAALKTGFMGGLGIYASSKQKQRIENNIQNRIETNITTDTLNQILNSFETDQTGTFKIKKLRGKACTFGQDAMLNIQADAIVSNFNDILADTQLVNEVKNTQQQKATITGEGLPVWLLALIAVGFLFVIGYGGGKVAWPLTILAIVFMIGYGVMMYMEYQSKKEEADKKEKEAKEAEEKKKEEKKNDPIWWQPVRPDGDDTKPKVCEYSEGGFGSFATKAACEARTQRWIYREATDKCSELTVDEDPVPANRLVYSSESLCKTGKGK